MKKESIILNVYPAIKNSLLLISFDELKFPEDIDFGSIKVVDNANKKLLFDLIDKKNYRQKLNYSSKINKNHICIILNRNNVKYIKIAYNLSKKQGKYASPEENIKINDDSRLSISTKDISISFEKSGYSIEKIKINKKEYGPLQLVNSGGNFFFQKNMENAEFDIISDSSIIKILKISGSMAVLGDKCAKEGFLPVEITYYFWSSDGKNIIAKAEIELKYDEATDLDGNRAEFLNPQIWYRLENFKEKLSANSLYENNMGESEITTLKHPYYAFFADKNAFLAMCPYLALPNDGIHIEKGRDFFGPSWHSLSEQKKPYWADEKESTGKPQGYFPSHSLRGYWKIGMYFDTSKKDIKKIAGIFSYQPKIQSILHLSSEQVSNAYITRWNGNKKIAFNAITDDAKINDYLYRAEGKMPKWVQIAIATRTLGINYHRFCYIGDKLFYLKKYHLLSTLSSTLLCFLGVGKPLRKKFRNENLSYLPHTNTHPKIYRLNAGRIIGEIKKSEKIWAENWNYKIPLSHVFSYTAPYGLATEKGTMEKAAFSASKCLQWIREWPIPNAPLDFFLPTRLFWGISIGEFFDENNCGSIKEEFYERRKNGCDYMLISGHVPEYGVECPQYVSEMFKFFEKHDDVWFADSDEIIKYYKARESMFVGRPEKHGSAFLMEIENQLPKFFSTEVTLIQNISKKINKIEFTLDKKNYIDVPYRLIGKKTVMYNVPSDANGILIS